MRNLLLLSCVGCLHAPMPASDPAVSMGLSREPMQLLDHARIKIYHPKSLELQARRLGQQLLNCRQSLSVTGRKAALRLTLIHPGFENAYVESGPSWPDHMVVPSNLTSPSSLRNGDSPNRLGNVVCHELVHAKQFAQIAGPLALLQRISGLKLNPQSYTESWFIEGLATVYQGGRGPPGLRPDSLYWRAAFEAYMAERRDFGAASLNPFNPHFSEFGGHYLVGGHFVGWLAATFSPERLWAFVQDQAEAWVPTIGTGMRFKMRFGDSADHLLGRFANAWRQKWKARSRPKRQRVLRPHVGLRARLARSPRTGELALLSQGLDRVPELEILDEKGRMLQRRRLSAWGGLDEPRVGNPDQVDGLEFSRDGALYFTVLQADLSGQARTILYRLDAQVLATTGRWDLGRAGAGGIHPLGHSYAFVRYEGDQAWLSLLDLVSGETTDLWTTGQSHPPLSPTWSPDGERIAFVRGQDSGQQQLWVWSKRKGARPVSAAFNLLYSPRFISQRKILVVCAIAASPQVCIHRLDQDRTQLVSKAPYGVLDPQARRPRGLILLNRTGRGWSLDQVDGRRVSQHVDGVAGQAFTEPGTLPLLQGGQIKPASRLRGLLKPRFLLPMVEGDSLAPQTWNLGFWLGGSDELLFNSYYILAKYQPSEGRPTFDLRWRHRSPAPWILEAEFGFEPELGRMNFSATRPYGPLLDVSWGLTGLRLSQGDLFLAGPRIGMDWHVREMTGRGVLRRAIIINGQAAWYPEVGRGQELVDGRGQLKLVLPSPFSGRQNLALTGLWRRIEGAPDGALTIGPRPLGKDLSATIPQEAWWLYRFQEFLPGYEDQGLATRDFRVAGADLRWRMPIHWGNVYTAYFLPSLYLRFLELNAFGRLAELDGEPHRSLGLTLSLHLVSGSRSPWSLTLSGAWRPDLQAPTHVSFGIRN